MKRLPALVCAIAILILLGSCSGGSEGATTAAGGASSDHASLQSSEASSEDPSDDPGETREQAPAAQKIAIRVNLTPAEEDAMQMLTEEFNASNGRGITVVVQNEYTADEDDVERDNPAEEDTESVTEAEASGTAGNSGVPVALLLEDVKTIRSMRGLQSLNERIAADYGNDPDVPATLRGVAETGGEQFGVPFDLDGSVFYYNASLYEKYDLTPPATWDELLQAGAVLAEEENCPAMVTDSLTGLTELLLKLNGTALTDGKRAAFAGSAGDETFTFLMAMLNDDCLLLADRGTCQDLFLAGRTAGYLGTGSDLADMYRNGAFAIGALPVPHPEGKETQASPCTMRVLALYPGDRAQQDAAWAFVRYLTNASVTARWAVATGHFPVRAAAYIEPEYASYMETSVAAKASTGAQYGYYLPETYSDDLQYRVREIIGRNMKSNVTGAEIAERLVQEINDSLSEN